MQKRFFYLFALLLVAVVVSAQSCQKQAAPADGGNTNEDAMMEEKDGDAMMEEGDKMMEGEDAMMDDGSMVVDENGVKVVTVEAGKFYFTPNKITVKKGDTVRIVMNNVDGFHDWVIDEFDAATEQINTGETAEVEFVANQVGEFEFYCSVGNHRALGMVGTLVVEEADDAMMEDDSDAMMEEDEE